MECFSELNLPEKLQTQLAKIGFTTPTPVQVQAIPAALEGKDILGSAKTGTGKTGAFGIPLVTKLLSSSRGSALVMCPTRELAVQVLEQLESFLPPFANIKTALLIGGESMPDQTQALRARPRIIVGTPGRINDHLERGSLMLHDANFLVLDETDRMLDMGFQIQIEAVIPYLPRQRQTLLFSATMPDNIQRIAAKYLTDPVRIEVGSTTETATNVEIEEVHLESDKEKYPHFLKQLDEREGSIIVFVKTKTGCDKLAQQLKKKGHEARAIHGDLTQREREKVINAYRDSEFRILVATDIAARGLDISHIEHVVNYDLPQAPEDYIHRIGRTARAGASGHALCYITPADMEKWTAIQRMMNPGATIPDAPKKKRSRGGKDKKEAAVKSASPKAEAPAKEKPAADKPQKKAESDEKRSKPVDKKPASTKKNEAANSPFGAEGVPDFLKF
jgi:superfamily II DNA/RNA helicase